MAVVGNATLNELDQFPNAMKSKYANDLSHLHDEQVWEMLLLAKLQWDVSGVTAFDFVDHLMERLPLCRSAAALKDVTNKQQSRLLLLTSAPSASTLVRGHALTYVSLCCTGKLPFFLQSILTIR